MGPIAPELTKRGVTVRALAVLDAQVVIQGASGKRVIPLPQLYLLPGTTPEKEYSLQPGELITAIRLIATDATRRSHYLKVRDRNSYAFALSSAAGALSVRWGMVQHAHLAQGWVGTVPYVISLGKTLRGTQRQVVGTVLFRRLKQRREF